MFNTLELTLRNLYEELGCTKQNELFLMIKASDENFTPKVYVYKKLDNEAPQFVREITLKEILTPE